MRALDGKSLVVRVLIGEPRASVDPCSAARPLIAVARHEWPRVHLRDLDLCERPSRRTEAEIMRIG